MSDARAARNNCAEQARLRSVQRFLIAQISLPKERYKYCHIRIALDAVNNMRLNRHEDTWKQHVLLTRQAKESLP